MSAPTASYPPLEDRPIKNTICLFDVDDTLTKPRLVRLLPYACACARSLSFFVPTPT